MGKIAENLELLWTEIGDYCSRCGRKREEIKLVVVSKNFPPDAVLEAYNYGQKVFGENRIQEMELKKSALTTLPLEWHMIGHIQSNKLKRVLKNSSLIHSIDNFELLSKAERICNEEGIISSFLLELNLSGEESKYGIRNIDQVFEICEKLPQFERMKFKGFMTMTPFDSNEDQQRRIFASLRELSEKIAEKFSFKELELSMGMSSDFGAAIIEGATILRIGTKIFGARG